MRVVVFVLPIELEARDRREWFALGSVELPLLVVLALDHKGEVLVGDLLVGKGDLHLHSDDRSVDNEILPLLPPR